MWCMINNHNKNKLNLCTLPFVLVALTGNISALTTSSNRVVEGGFRGPPTESAHQNTHFSHIVNLLSFCCI